MKEFSPGRIIISSAIALIAMYSYKHTSHKMVLEMDQEDAQKLDSRVAKSKNKTNSLANKNKDDSSNDKLSTLWRRPSSVGGELPTKEASSADLPSPEGTDDELPTPPDAGSEVASSDPGADAASGDSNTADATNGPQDEPTDGAHAPAAPAISAPRTMASIPTASPKGTTFSNTSIAPKTSTTSSTGSSGSGASTTTTPTPTGTGRDTSVSTTVIPPTLSTDRPSGSYMTQPFIAFSSSDAESIKYCIGTAATGAFCCDPDAGSNYGLAFQPGAVDGVYCVSAKAYKTGATSSPMTWNYHVDASMVSLNLTVPQRTYYQTQQLFSLMTVDSTQFGDPTLNFLQRVTTTDPGPTACDGLAYTSSPVDDMQTSLGFMVNFGAVSAPFQVPLLFTNKITYGANYVLSILEMTAHTPTEHFCLQNTIHVNDFYLQTPAASAAPAFPGDGSYSFQGSLGLYTGGKSIGSNGITLEHGVFNIIN